MTFHSLSSGIFNCFTTFFVGDEHALSTDPMSFSPGVPMDNVDKVLVMAKEFDAPSSLRHLLLASKKAWCKLL